MSSRHNPGTDPAIQIQAVCKAYRLYNSPAERLKEALHPFKKKYHREFFALRDLDLTVPRGQTWGIIGLNGSGKSTLLKIVCGVTQPSSGRVEVRGRISALLELGAGFNPEFTGRDNVFFSGALAGLDRREMERRYPDIVRFADIGEYIDQPVKNYSSGMLVRLAFAVSIHVDPDILIIDEALAVGDARFQQKCLARIKEFKGRSTILFVTHDISAIAAFCDQAVWLHQGRLMSQGPPNQIINQYIRAVYEGGDAPAATLTQESPPPVAERTVPTAGCEAFGSGRAVIAGLTWLVQGQASESVRHDDPIRLELRVTANEPVLRPVAGFVIKNRLGLDVVVCNNLLYDRPLAPMAAGETWRIGFEFRWPNLSRGAYAVSVAVADGTLECHEQLHWIHDAIIVQCLQPIPYMGILNFGPSEIKLTVDKG